MFRQTIPEGLGNTSYFSFDYKLASGGMRIHGDDLITTCYKAQVDIKLLYILSYEARDVILRVKTSFPGSPGDPLTLDFLIIPLIPSFGIPSPQPGHQTLSSLTYQLSPPPPSLLSSHLSMEM